MLEFPQWISVVNAEEMTVKKKSENSMTVNQVNEAQVVLFFNSYQTTTVQQ